MREGRPGRIRCAKLAPPKKSRRVAMNTEWWKKVEDTYHSARELKAQERSDFLDAACGTDTALRRQVEVLLGQEENPDSLLNKPALAHAENLRSSATFP